MRTFLLIVSIAAMVSADGAGHHGDHAHGEHAHGDHAHGEAGHGDHAHEDHGGHAKDLSAAPAAPVSSYDVPVAAPIPASFPAYSLPVAPVVVADSYAAPAVVADSYAAPQAPVADSYAAPSAPVADSYAAPAAPLATPGTDTGYYYYYYPVVEEPLKKEVKKGGIDTPTILIIVLVVIGILLLGTNLLFKGRSFSTDPYSIFMETFNLDNDDLSYYSNMVYKAIATEY